MLLVDRADFLAEVVAEAGASAAGFQADLETYDGAQAAMRFAGERFGGVDILINNVGGAIRMRPFSEFEPEQIDAEIRRSACRPFTDAMRSCRTFSRVGAAPSSMCRPMPRGGSTGALFGSQGRHQRHHAVVGDGAGGTQHP